MVVKMAGSRPFGLKIPPSLDLNYLTDSQSSSATSSPLSSPELHPTTSYSARNLALAMLRQGGLPGLAERRGSEGSLSSGVCSPLASPRFSNLAIDVAQSTEIQHEDAIPSPFPFLLSRVREGARLGQGSFGQVFQADYIDEGVVGDRSQPQVPAVIKKLSTDKRGCPGQLQAFRDELTALDALDGVSSPRLMDYNLNPHRPSYLMTKADGKALNQFEGLNPETHPDPLVREQHAKKLARAILDALETFHERGFCHRDIKPDNVFLATLEDGSYKITFVDLGYATPVGKAMDTPFGNSKYTISCEDGPSAASIDLFAVGATLNAMACSGEHDVFALQPSTDFDDTHGLPTDEMFAFIKHLCNREHQTIGPVLKHDWLRLD